MTSNDKSGNDEITSNGEREMTCQKLWGVGWRVNDKWQVIVPTSCQMTSGNDESNIVTSRRGLSTSYIKLRGYFRDISGIFNVQSRRLFEERRFFIVKNRHTGVVWLAGVNDLEYLCQLGPFQIDSSLGISPLLAFITIFITGTTLRRVTER